MIDPLSFTVFAGAAIASGLLLAGWRPEFVVRHPYLILGILAAISLGAAGALVRLDPLGFTIDIDPASEPLIHRNDPGKPIYAQAILDFGSDDVYVIALETDDIFTTETLELVDRLTNRLRKLQGVAIVESLTRALAVRYDSEREMIDVGRLIDRIPTQPEALADLRSRTLADPIYRKTLISADGRTTAINISFRPMSDADFIELDLDGKIEALLREEKGEGRTFYIAGRPHVRAKAYHTMVRDLGRLIPVAVAISAAVLWLMWGSVSAIVIPLTACLTSTLWVFGGMAVLQIDINLITLVLGSLMICIGSVYGVHVYARFELIASESSDVYTATLECLRYTRTPVLMAGFTTCIGFGALLLSNIPATNELGAFSILGVAAVTLISLTGVPAALVLLPEQVAREQQGTRLSNWFSARLDAILAGIGSLAVRHTDSILVVWGILAIASVALLPRITIDTDVITFFSKTSPVRTDFAAINRLLTGAVPIYVLVSGEEEGAFREPATLEAITQLQSRLEDIVGVSQVLSSVDFIRMANRAMLGENPGEDRIPATRAGVAEATFLLPKSKLRHFSTSNHSRGNLIVRTGQAGSAAVRALEAEIQAVLADTTLPAGFTTNVTGNAILLNRSADGIANRQAAQVGSAAVTIFALMCFVFRSVRLGLISMLPNIIPVLIFFGVLGSGLAKLSLPTSLIGCIALGIAVDDTMHFLVAYRAQRQKGLPPAEAVQDCVARVGRPIVMTSVMLVVGFLVILASGFATLQEFGYLTAVTMAICLTTDLILLPALLVRGRV